jgi:hypothetical protein
MIMETHLFTMVIYALLVSLVLSLIRRSELKARLKYGVTLFLIMVVGALVFGWFMFLFIR